MNRRFWLISGLVLACLLGLTVPVLADYGLEETAGAAGIQTTKPITQVLGDVIGTGLSLVSVLFFGLMLYAGIKWMLARGEEAEATKAKDTIIAAVIGLVVVLGSYALTSFVFKSVGAGAGGGGTTPKAGAGTCVFNPAWDSECQKADATKGCVILDWSCTTNDAKTACIAGGSSTADKVACPKFTSPGDCTGNGGCLWNK